MLDGPLDVEDHVNPDISNTSHTTASESDAPRKPASAPVPQVRANASSSKHNSNKPRSTAAMKEQLQTSANQSSSSSSKRKPAKRPDMTDLQTCPICGKSMQADNRAFNAHIDFCLSKDAITQAQVSASGRKPSSNTLNTLRVRSPQKSANQAGKKRKDLSD